MEEDKIFELFDKYQDLWNECDGGSISSTNFRNAINEALRIYNVSYFAEQTKNVLINKFCNIAKEHIGETFDKIPEATDILKAICVIEKHCS